MEEKSDKAKKYLEATTLPDQQLDGYWDDIIIDQGTKEALINYCLSVSKMASLSGTRCAIYRTVLLEGEPGTGKTTLAIGTANRVARLLKENTGQNAKLFQFNLGMLFNSLLGESVKRMSEVFQVTSMASRQGLVFCLLDEVESVGIERGNLGQGDPTEVLRVVNELLVGIDRLRTCGGKSVIIMTSNFPQAIDRALRDRTDVDFHIGMPGRETASRILQVSGQELRKLKVNVTPLFVNAVINAIYNGNDATPMSGRDVSRLLPLTMAMKGRRQVTVKDVVEVAGMLIKRNERKKQNGNS